jgi:hypothetical protein
VPPGAVASFGGTRQGSWKVAEGSIWIMRPGQKWDHFGDSTVGTAVKALTELYPAATFAVNPRVAEMPVGDLITRADDPLSDLKALHAACGNAFEIQPGMKGLFLLEPNSSTLAAPTPKPEDRTVECFNLTGYLGRITAHDSVERAKQTDAAINQLQEIIQVTIGSFDESLSRNLAFHFYPQAQLFIVTGPQRATDVARKVINALPGQQSITDNNSGRGHVVNSLTRLPDPASRQETPMEQELTPAKGGALPKAAPSPVLLESDPADKP